MQQEEAREAGGGRISASSSSSRAREPRRGARCRPVALAAARGAQTCASSASARVVRRRVAVAEVVGQVEAAALAPAEPSRRTASGRSAMQRAPSRAGRLSTCSRLPRRSASQASSGRAAADRDERVLQRAAPALVHVHVVRRDRRQVERARAARAGCAVAGAVAAPGAGAQLDAQAARARTPRAGSGRGRARSRGRRARARRGARSRSGRQALGVLAQSARAAAARDEAVGAVRRGDRAAEVAVARARSRTSSGDVEAPCSIGDRQLGAGDRPDAGAACGMRELERAAEVVVIGQREGLEAELVPPAAASSSGCEAPSRKEKAEWQCSSA